jgi:hypothetical protein
MRRQMHFDLSRSCLADPEYTARAARLIDLISWDQRDGKAGRGPWSVTAVALFSYSIG